MIASREDARHSPNGAVRGALRRRNGRHGPPAAMPGGASAPDPCDGRPRAAGRDARHRRPGSGSASGGAAAGRRRRRSEPQFVDDDDPARFLERAARPPTASPPPSRASTAWRSPREGGVVVVDLGAGRGAFTLAPNDDARTVSLPSPVSGAQTRRWDARDSVKHVDDVATITGLVRALTVTCARIGVGLPDLNRLFVANFPRGHRLWLLT